MADEFSVSTGALRADAGVWRGWQDRLSDISTAVPTVGVDMDPLAFSRLPGAAEIRQVYASLAARLANEAATGATVLGGVADTLTAVADLYEAAESDVARSFRL
jgi:hypothetical protein